MQGWIQLHRKFLEWEWYEDNNTKVLFIHCLLKANHKDKKWRGKVIERGSFITSYAKLSQETGLSVRNVRTCLNNLEATREVTRQSTNDSTTLTICNYDTYQNADQQSDMRSDTPTDKRATNERQATDKQTTTTNNENNINNDKNEECNSFSCAIDPNETFKPAPGKIYEFHKIYSEIKPFDVTDIKLINAYYQAVNQANGEDVVNMGAQNYVDFCKVVEQPQRFTKKAIDFLTQGFYNTDWKKEAMNELKLTGEKGDTFAIDDYLMLKNGEPLCNLAKSKA